MTDEQLRDPLALPPEVDTSVPSVARIYDYAVGGKDNFRVDRDATHAMLDGVPDIIATARANRAFLGRGVRYLAREAGIRQFIDFGSGLPTQLNVHQVAQAENPDGRVVYVDNDPVVLAHGRALLSEDQRTTVIQADMAQPTAVLESPATRRLINFAEPVGVLYLSVLHCLPDEARPDLAVAAMLDAVPAGSHLMMSHLVSDDADAAEFLTRFMTEQTTWGRVRTEAEVTAYFDGLDAVEPGLVDITRWRPEQQPTDTGTPFDHDIPSRPELEGKIWEFGGIARKP
ncbi:SAM-dependent methyltransferase [Saccharopolyspora gloriosae]|uniref:SAM-dependent methyltransferase n=1 Tax=Saccharopolyspora gloriosae TaxID=455344 RepID=UPI001FB70C05|nr:SAM-dependent methyltransferase [Saccharopolyspora gloriosae]